MENLSMIHKICITILFSLISLNANSQSYLITKPLSWINDHAAIAPLVIETPDVSDWDRKLNKSYYDIMNLDSTAAQDYPQFVSVDHKVEISRAHGYSFITENNEFVWICRVQFPALEKIQLLSSDFFIPGNAKLFIYSSQGERLLKSINSKKNNPSGIFNTGPISVNDLVIEYNEKLSEDGIVKGRFDFDRVAIYFKNSIHSGRSLGCHNNVNCNPWHDELCKEIRSAVKLEIHATVEDGPNAGTGGFFRCSGGLLNNSNFDLRPLILSARHCITDFNDDDGHHWIVDQPETWVAYYNFQSPVCAPTTMGNDEMVTVGMNELGRDWCADLLTLEVTDNAGLFPRIPIQYNYFMNAWHLLSLDNGTAFFGVHHPSGDLKKVSEGEKVTSAVPCHWKVSFSNGIVEEGSSGSPLLDDSHFTIGSLSFSFAQDACDINSYYYGALKNANRDVLSPLDNGEEDIVSISAIDPIAACLDHVDIYGNLFPGASWLAAQNQITIQAENTISVAPGVEEALVSSYPSVFGQNGVQTSPATSSDYIFIAGQSITFFPGFSINVPAYGAGTNNVLSARIGPCLSFTGCGFNYAKKELLITHTDSILNSNSIIRAQSNYGTKYYLKRDFKEKSTQAIQSNQHLNSSGGSGHLNLYPNPAQNKLEIIYTELFTYQVSDIFGKIIMSGNVTQGSKTNIDITSFAPGVYFVKAEANNNYEIRKFIKQ